MLKCKRVINCLGGIMKNLLKAFCIAMAIVLSLSVIACSGGNPPGDGDGDGDGGEGESTYTGYDGYVWEEDTKTSRIDSDFVLDDEVLESTIGIESAPMNTYFNGDYVDLSSSYVAMMCYYLPTYNRTGYSKTVVEEITINAESSGVIYVGTAKLEDVYNARITGSSLNCQTEAYQVDEGNNTLMVEIFVDNESTLVLGGNNSVGVYYAEGIDQNDQQGVFTQLNGTTHNKTQLFSQTAGVKDKLAIQTKIVNLETITDDNKRTYKESEISSLNTVALEASPFAYQSTYFKNSKIMAIELPVKTVDSLNGNYTFTIWVGSSSVVANGQFGTAHTINIPQAKIQSTTVNKWITVDVSSYNIQVGNNQTLLFGRTDDTVKWGWSGVNKTSSNVFYNSNGQNVAMNANLSANIPVNVYMLKDDFYVPDRIDELKESQLLINELGGKHLSIIGDSISTFQGWNNNTNTNTTIGGNAVFYDPAIHHSVMDKADDCWWKLTADRTGMNMLVNGAWSGSATIDETGLPADEYNVAYLANASTSNRAINLHANTGVNNGKKPDIIFCFMGTNDSIRYPDATVAGTYEAVNFNNLIQGSGSSYTYNISKNANNIPIFAEAYAVMLHKMQIAYPDAQIFCMSILPYVYGTAENHGNYNLVIQKMAEHFGCGFIDTYNDSGITFGNYTNYTVDGLHPNEVGMKMMSDCVINYLLEYYA